MDLDDFFSLFFSSLLCFLLFLSVSYSLLIS